LSTIISISFAVANLLFVSRFVRGKVPGLNTGFDIDEADHSEMQLCQSTVVASAIFGNYNFGFQSSLQIAFTLAYKYYVHLLTNFSGNYDVMQQPENISKFSKDTVCFFMFLDEETEAAIKNTTIGHTKKIGLWRVVVVRNLPFTDARRNGKVPMQLEILIFLIQTCVIRNLPCCSVFFSMN
jgi:hypothetical protein